MNIVEIIPRQDLTLFVRADNGQDGVFDMHPYLEFEAFRPLAKLDEFFNLQNGRYFVEWQCGADLSADTIFSKWQCQNKTVQPFAPGDAPQAARP